MVALTYDAPELQAAFIEQEGITYPFLSDVEARSVKAMKILNTEYEPGHGAYGIPWPGIFVVDPQGIIVGKLFVEPYSIRVDAAGVLSYAREVLKL